MLLDKVVIMGMTFGLAWADQNAGFDSPGPPDDSVDSPTYRIGDTVLIKWHMNFTDALLKLVHTPNDHTSTSWYIISEPTNATSHEWTATTFGLNADTGDPGFYFSVYKSSAQDASFISHNIFLLAADSSSSSSSATSVMSTTTTSSSTPASTMPTTTPTGTPTSAAGTDKGSQGIGGGVIAGIAVGSVVATLIVAGLAGWCFWSTFVKKRRAENGTVQGQQTTDQQQHLWGQYGDLGYPHPQSHKPELPNNEISELEGMHDPSELAGQGYTYR
ncbi:hypothetical protein FHL15_010538 [Xylaria flabelliformis]|uniref:Mid2 domain-containing protein n=1 Tax=Xylaria flabelliformis TaxID=2512241 RepID=A0A553HKW7_9PEZI|nr:hypothetical protein FHL15_010538 [Xylaria flabelliformis]